MKSRQDANKAVLSGRFSPREWLDVWLETFVRPPNRAERTYKSYHDILRAHVPEGVGKLPLAKLAPETLQLLFTRIAATGHTRTASLLRDVLRAALNRAVRIGRLENNPVLATDAPRHIPQESETFTPDEAQRFKQAAELHRLGALFITALSLGLRKGEVCGLKPDDIDHDERKLRIRRALSWSKQPGEEVGRWIERPPKRGSLRDLPLPPDLYTILLSHLSRRDENRIATGDKWHDSGYLFTSVTGAPLHERNVSEAFHQLCDACGVPRIRFHDTRHTCGTMLHALGASPFTIQKILGHSQLSTTRRYTQVPAEVAKTALDSLSSLLNEPKPLTVKLTVNSKILSFSEL
jgi:integrase